MNTAESALAEAIESATNAHGHLAPGAIDACHGDLMQAISWTVLAASGLRSDALNADNTEDLINTAIGFLLSAKKHNLSCLACHVPVRGHA